MALHQNSAFSYRVIRLGDHWVYISIVENTNGVGRLQGMDKTVANVSCTKPPIPYVAPLSLMRPSYELASPRRFSTNVATTSSSISRGGWWFCTQGAGGLGWRRNCVVQGWRIIENR